MTSRRASSASRIVFAAIVAVFALSIVAVSFGAVREVAADETARVNHVYDSPSAATTLSTKLRTNAALASPSPRPSPGVVRLVPGYHVAAKGAPRGWQRGDDIWAKTRAGDDPAWSTVRGRYWKNVADDPAQAAQWDAANLARMRSGRAPQRFNADKGGMESMELSHEPIPGRLGGRGLVPRWPQDHAAVDPFRHPGY